jgi:hypothetical protein
MHCGFVCYVVCMHYHSYTSCKMVILTHILTHPVWALIFERYWVFTWFYHWSRYESERIPLIKEILEKTKESEENDDKTRLLSYHALS